LHEAYKGHPLVNIAVAPHAPYTVDNDGFTLVKKVAEGIPYLPFLLSFPFVLKLSSFTKELNLKIHTHLHETENEVVEHVARHGVRPIQRLDDLGLITPSLIAVHMTQLTEEEIKLFASKGK
jgi:5-methylthioadenosine/S-adenosylhomocysteine deaminase